MPTGRAMGDLLSPNQAAHRAGVSRRSVMRAVEAGEVAAHRDNRNAWRIDADALHAWRLRSPPTPPNARPSGPPTPDAQPAQPSAHTAAHLDTARLQAVLVEVELLRERLAAADRRNGELEAERDGAVADARAERTRANVERDRADAERKQLLALLERMTTAPAVQQRPQLWERVLARFGRRR